MKYTTYIFDIQYYQRLRELDGSVRNWFILYFPQTLQLLLHGANGLVSEVCYPITTPRLLLHGANGLESEVRYTITTPRLLLHGANGLESEVRYPITTPRLLLHGANGLESEVRYPITTPRLLLHGANGLESESPLPYSGCGGSKERNCSTMEESSNIGGLAIKKNLNYVWIVPR